MSCASVSAPAWPAYFTALSAVVAAFGFIFSLFKQRSDAKLQRELEAKRRWAAFMDSAFDHPESAYKPAYSWKLDRKSSTESRPLEDVSHKNFISRFLFTAEEVLALVPDDDEWKNSIKSQMDCHKRYFKDEMNERSLNCYSKELKAVIAEWKTDVGKKAEKEKAAPNA